jgi:hypothetical protein
MKLDLVILILICISILFVTLNSVMSDDIQNHDNLITDSLLASNNITGTVIADLSSESSVEVYETANGMDLTLGRVDNYGNGEKNVIVPIEFAGKTLYYNLTLEANMSWTYAAINGILILPHTPMIIDPTKTCYYPSGDQLIISIEKDYNEMSEIEIYSKEPSIIMAGTPIRWYYDYNSGSLLIAGYNHFNDITLYFSKFIPQGTVFIEDRKNAEELEYRAEKLEESFMTMNTTIIPLAESASNLTGELEAVKSTIRNTTIEIELINNTIPVTNSTIKAFEEKVSANVVLSPSGVVITIIIALILIVILIDALVLTKKVKE